MLVVVLAACGGDAPGLRLEIRAGTTGAVTIELYLGTRPCQGCDNRLAPKGVVGKLPGEVWYLDGNAVAGTPNTAATLNAGRYVYDLRAEDPAHDGTLAHVLVVGYDAQKKVVGVASLSDVPVAHDATDWYRVTLGPATDSVSSDRLTPAGERVYVWRRTDPELAACVGYEQASDAGVKRLWFVPEDDTDCDQVATAECDRYAYKASGKADIGEANCVTAQFSVPNTVGKACLLGGPACIDGVPSNTSCGPVGPSYCLPDAICASATCAQNLGDCLRDGQMPGIPRIRCDFPFNTQGTVCGTTAEQRHDEIDLRPLLASPTNPATTITTCKSILFADPMLGMANVSDKITMGAVEIKPDPITAPCQWGMSWVTGNVAMVGGPTPPIVRMTIVELENGNRMLLPIELAFHPTACAPTDVVTCGFTIAPTDGVTHCAQQP